MSHGGSLLAGTTFADLSHALTGSASTAKPPVTTLSTFKLASRVPRKSTRWLINPTPSPTEASAFPLLPSLAKLISTLSSPVWRKVSVTIFAHLDKVHQLRLDAEARRIVEERMRREAEEEQRQQHARRLTEIVERMRVRLTSSGYGFGLGHQQQQGAGPSFGGAGGGGYGYGGGAGSDLSRPFSPEERAVSCPSLIYIVTKLTRRWATALARSTDRRARADHGLHLGGLADPGALRVRHSLPILANISVAGGRHGDAA